MKRKSATAKGRVYWLVRAAPKYPHQTEDGFLACASDAIVPMLFKTKAGAIQFGPVVKVRLSREV